ncbi:hypothetical protein WA158_005964 [Blastocystis sp. Blastoise]
MITKYLFAFLDLFTFQDETKLWIPKEIIEKYQQLPFRDIIEHSEKYEDGSYYIDMPSLSMKSVIDFLMEENMDIDSLNLRDSYDIYKTLIEYSITINNVIQSDLLFHVKELFYKYLEDNNCDVSGYYCKDKESRIPIELFNLEEKEILVDDLLTFQRKEELLYYSPLFKMMNITTVNIAYYYASNIPLEYICPSCIKDIFPSLKQVKITVIIHYKKTELLLNPNSDDYIMEYARLLDNDEPRISKRKKYEYYTESDMNEYNKISSLDLNKYYYSRDLINSYNEKREKNELPKLYKYVVNEVIYSNDYSEVSIYLTDDEYALVDDVYIEYDIKELTRKVNDNLFKTIMTTHVFPNVIELYEDGCFKLSLIKKECFPKLHIINYDSQINTYNFKSLFPDDLINMIDTIRISGIDNDQKEEIASLLDNLVYTHSIHIDISSLYNYLFYFPHLKEILEKNLVTFNSISIHSSSSDIKKLHSIENYKQNIDSLNITFEDGDQDEIDKRNALEKFLKSNIVEHLNKLTVKFDYYSSTEYLTWISTLFNENKFNNVQKLTIYLRIEEDSSSEYLTAYENIVEKIIPKASIVNIEYCSMTFLNRLIPKGCFHNTTQLILIIKDIPDENFCKLYTTDNFPQLKSIKIYENDKEWYISFIKVFCTYMNNNNFQLSSFVRLSEKYCDHYTDYIYDPNNSIFRCKYDTNSFMNTIIGAKYHRILYEQIDICKQQLNDSSFIQENHVKYNLLDLY